MRAGLVSLARRFCARRRTAVAVLALAGGVAVAAASHGQTSVGVLKVRVGGDSHQTRMVIELDRPTKGQLLSGQAPAEHVSLALAKLDVPGDMQGEGAGWSVTSMT